jgi:hypothetical protein
VVVILLPVIDRELRIRARRDTTYWLRAGVAGLAAVAAALELVLAANANGQARAGGVTFKALSWLGMGMAFVSSLATADALSGERRDGTLGLLFQTALRPFDVVLGKLTVSSISAVYCMAAFLPALAFVSLSGGVGLWQIVRTALALLDAAFVSLAAGMWVSGRVVARHHATRGALLAVFVICVAPRILMNVGMAVVPRLSLLGACSPLTAFYLAPDVAYTGARIDFWISIAAVHGLGWLLLASTAATLRRKLLADDEVKPAAEPFFVPLVESEVQSMAQTKTEMLQKDPICWIVTRLRMHNGLIWAGSLVFLLAGSGFSWARLTTGVASAGLGSLYLLISLFSAGLLAWAAGRFFFEAQRNGEFEMILSTPLGAADVVSGTWRAICQPLRGAWLPVLFLILLQFLLAGGHGSGVESIRRAVILINRALDIVAICWVGMWFGLTSRKPFSIMGWTAGLVIALPWIVSYLLVIGMASSSRTAWGSPGFTPPRPATALFWFFLWPILEIAKDIFLVGWAAGRLRSNLRTSASLSAGNLTA